MKSLEQKGCKACSEPPKCMLNPQEMETAFKEEFGETVFVEVTGVMHLPITENIDLEIDSEEMTMKVTGSINLQSHEPMEGIPDFDRYIAQVSLLPRISEILLQSGFNPVEWGVNEFRGPGNGMCSVLMSKSIACSSVEHFINELKTIRDSLKKLDS